MRTWMVIVVCGLLAGCDYTVPLAKTPEMGIDAAMVGLWQRVQDNGQTERLLVLPLGEKEFMVSFPAGVPNAMFARACLCRGGDEPLVQLEWIGTAQAELPGDGRVFQFAKVKVSGDTITVWLLNADLVKREVKTSAELATSIADNRHRPDLFRAEMVFRKVDAEKGAAGH